METARSIMIVQTIALVVIMALTLPGVRSEVENTQSDLNDVNEETACYIEDENCSSKAEKEADADHNILRFVAGCCDCKTEFKRQRQGTKLNEHDSVYDIVQTDSVEQYFPTDKCVPNPKCIHTQMAYSAEYYTTADKTETAFSLFTGLGTTARCLNQ